MKKAIVSMLLCVFAMRLAVIAGAEEEIKRWVLELEEESAARTEEVLYADDNMEIADVGRIDLVPVVFSSEGGESALNEGEQPEPEPLAASFHSELSIRNDTSFEIDARTILDEGPQLSLSGKGPHVLIVHTHGSEAYTQSGIDRYVESDPYRTEDKEKNVIKVGDALASVLESKGIEVIHDREIYDYPSYTGSYSRSGAAVEKYLAEYPEIAIVIDLHRDALGSGDTVYKTRADSSLGDCAQVMLLVGTGENGLSHPNWDQNLALALYLQAAMEERYPSLARPLSLKSERYNQHLSTGAMIIEVGSTGNTLAEAVRAIELFGDAAGDALKSLQKSE